MGTTTVQQVNANYRSAEYGIMIHNPDNFEKGYGTDTTKVMLWVANSKFRPLVILIAFY